MPYHWTDQDHKDMMREMYPPKFIVPGDFMDRDVLATPNDQHRLWLARQALSELDCTIHRPMCVFLMLNPSKARGEGVGDPTQRKCHGFATRGGYQRYGLVNLFSKSTPYPDELFDFGYDDAVGEHNDTVLSEVFRRAARENWTVICAWGKPSRLKKHEMAMLEMRIGTVMNLIPTSLTPVCLGTTPDGFPRHPLMVPYLTPLQPWCHL